MTLQSGRARRAINGPPAPFPRIKSGVPCCPFSCEDRPSLSPLPPCPILFTRLARECSTHALGRRNPSTKGGWHQPSLMPSSFRKASKVSSRSYGRGAQAHVQGFGLKAFAPFAFRERFRFPGRQGPPHTALATFSFHSKRGDKNMKPLDLSDKSALSWRRSRGPPPGPTPPTPATCISGYILNSCEGIT